MGRCLIFATLGGKMVVIPPGWRGVGSATRISTPMLAGFWPLSASGREAAFFEVGPGGRARVFDFRIRRAS
jgi:hypothetical protein